MISKGAFAKLRTAGIDFLRKSLVELVPEFSVGEASAVATSLPFT
ncbi:hypothetical protein [Okeania sp. SIO3B5]|nr:hypothetical protein [Okeania sp. SIO3B5]